MPDKEEEPIKMDKKTKEELEKELELAIAEAKVQYNSIVKPAQEKYKLKEQQARILFEQTTKPLYEKLPQTVIDAAEDAYRKVVANAISDYYKIEKPAKAEKYAAIRLANQQYDDAIKELRRVSDWFAFRRTYQDMDRKDLKTELESLTYEETKATKKVAHFGKDEIMEYLKMYIYINEQT